MFRQLFKNTERPAADPLPAFAGLSADDPQLLRAVRETPEAATRIALIGRVADAATLGTLREADGEEAVRAAAEERLMALYRGCGEGERAPLIAALRGSPGLETLAAEVDSAVALEDLLAQMLPEQWLRLATGGRDARIRKAAAERISDPDHLAQVIETLHGRDKGVVRIARDRLHRQRRREQEVARQEAVCHQLESLLAAPPEADLPARLATLEQAWRALDVDHPDPLLQGRFDAATARLRALVARSKESHSAHAALGETIARLLARLDDTVEADPTLSEEGAAMLERLAQLPPSEQEVFQETARELRAALGRTEQNTRRAAALRQVLDWAREAARDGAPPPGVIQEFDRRWAGLEPPDHPVLARALGGEYKQQRHLLEQALERARTEQQQLLASLDGQLAELAAAVEEGALRRALSLRDQLRSRLARVAPAQGRQRQSREQRLNQLAKSVEAMKGWRRWGTVNAREELCEEMEGLAEDPSAPAEAAKRVRAARQKWKRIDQDEGPAPQDLWRRFDQACTGAYAPYQAVREAEARERERHIEHRRRISAELRRYLEETDWAQPDWQEADRQLQQARRAWRKAGPVKPSDYKRLNKDFQQICDELDGHLEGERRRERQRREGLIARLRELAGQEDLGRAISEAKSAQREWQPRVRSGRRVEQELWEAFRAVCDDIFARRDEARRERETASEAARREREALCEQVERLAGEPDGDPDALIRELQGLRRAWSGAGDPGPRTGQALERRFRGGVQALEGRVESRRSEEARQRLDRLALAAQRCAELEAAVLAEGAAGEVDAAREAWQASVDPLPPESLLRQRAEAALSAAQDPTARSALLAASADAVAPARGLCLELELLAGVESPPEFRQDRMEMQVARLNRALHGEKVPDSPGAGSGGALAELLARWLETAGPLPGAERERQAQRLEAVWRQLPARPR